MATPTLSSATFWADVVPLLGTLLTDGALSYVVLDHSTKMRIIRRKTKATMTSVVSAAAPGMKVVVNGNMFSAGGGARIWARLNSADDAKDTTPLGRLVDKGAYVGGSSSPMMFYFAQITVPFGRGGASGPLSFRAGAGDPPSAPDVQAAVGGVGPLIISGLSFGSSNVFAPGAPVTPPTIGQPPQADVPFLRQRSNATFDAIERRPKYTGKAILASCWAQRKLIVMVQPHGAAAGVSYTDIRDSLTKLRVDQAVFLDGSDSVFLWAGGQFAATPATYKDDLDTVAIGFT
jgi:hypothetical protein